MKTTTAVAALSLVVATGCSRKGAGGPACIPVTVARAEQRAVPYEIIATGTVEPRQTVSVQSQVTGVLTQVAFREGDDVAAGQVLCLVERCWPATRRRRRAPCSTRSATRSW